MTECAICYAPITDYDRSHATEDGPVHEGCCPCWAADHLASALGASVIRTYPSHKDAVSAELARRQR